jgi:hypothetical protein
MKEETSMAWVLTYVSLLLAGLVFCAIHDHWGGGSHNHH